MTDPRLTLDTTVPKATTSTERLRLTIAVILLILTLVGPAFGTYLVVFAEGDATKEVNGLADVVVDMLALGLFLTALSPMFASLIVSRRGISRYPARSPWFKAIFAAVMLSGPNVPS